jgi:hypothetical protein
MKNRLLTILPFFLSGLVLEGILYPAQSLRSNTASSNFELLTDVASDASLAHDHYYVISASSCDRMPWETLALPIEVTEEDTSEKDIARTSIKGSFKRFQSKYCQFLRSHVSQFCSRLAQHLVSSRLFVLFEVYRL